MIKTNVNIMKKALKNKDEIPKITPEIISDNSSKVDKKLKFEKGRTEEEILQNLQEIADIALQNGDLRTALRCLEAEGKHLGMFTKKTEINADICISSILEDGVKRVKKLK